MNHRTHISYRVSASIGKRRLRSVLLATVVAAAIGGQLITAGCVPIRDYRGFVAKADTTEQLRIGASRAEVEEIMGTPSASSSIGGESYYYISSVFETTAFFEPEEVDRTVYAIQFDDSDRVSRIAHYGLQDGKLFDFISRKTPTRGKELTFVQELFGNIGRFTDGSSLARDQILGDKK